MSPSPVLVTGASGFLASHVILKLLSDGHAVRGSVRHAGRGDHIRAVLDRHGADTSRLDFVELDLMADRGWDDAMAGVKRLIHTASPFVTHIPKDEDELVRPAVDGTRRALNAALSAGVERIVLTSSEVAMARGHPIENTGPFGEADWTDIAAPDVTPYMKSKTLAEREAWRIIEAAGRRDDLSVVNPGFILGPLLEQDVGTSGGLIAQMMLGKVPGAPNVHFASVDVRDVAALHVAALDDARGFGRRIPVSNDCVAMGDFADMLATVFPDHARKLPTRRLPDFLVRLISLVNRDARSALPLLGRRFAVDHALAVEMLGRDLIDTETAVVAMAQSQIDLGLV